MADNEFSFDEMLSGSEESEDVPRSNTRNTNNTSDSSTTDNTDSSLHPFSVRLDQEYVDIIKALAWWKRISQREFLENCLNHVLEKMDKDHIEMVLKRYKNKNV
jgi:hypothetical protein